MSGPLSRLALIFALGLLVTTTQAANDTCSSTQCIDGSVCAGFSYQICTNSTTNESYNGAICFTASHCKTYSAQDSDIVLTLTGVSPKTIYELYGYIQTAIMRFYNNFCWSGENYQLCCPGATGGPTSLDGPLLQAMTNATAEVNILSAYGSERRTVMAVRLAPSSDSPLCQNVSYVQSTTSVATTASATTGTPATTAPSPPGSAPTMMSSSPMMTSSPMESSSMASAPMESSSKAPAPMESSSMASSTMESSSMASSSMESSSMASSTMESSSMASSPMESSSMASALMESSSMASSPMSLPSTMESSPEPAPSPKRRRRDLRADDLGNDQADLTEERGIAEDKVATAEEAHHHVLSRQRRATPSTISLPASTIANITSSTNFTEEIRAALETQRLNVTVAVSLASTATTTVMPTTTPKSASGLLGHDGGGGAAVCYGSVLVVALVKLVPTLLGETA